MEEGSDEFLQDLPLPVLFGICENFYNQLEAVNPSKEQSKFRRGVSALRRCHTLAELSSLYSANEEQDDLATSDMKYLLVPYFLAEVLNRSSFVDASSRRAVVAEAMSLYSQFLHRYCPCAPEGSRIRLA